MVYICSKQTSIITFDFPAPSVVSRLASGAAVDSYQSNKQRHTSVISLLDTTRDRRAEEEENRGVRATTADYSKDGEAEEYDDDYYYYEEYEDGTSGDYELQLPRGKALKKCLKLVLLSGF